MPLMRLPPGPCPTLPRPALPLATPPPRAQRRPDPLCLRPAPAPPRFPPRSDDIIRWVKKKTGPATTEVATVEALETAQKDNKVFVLGFFDKLDGDDAAAFEAGAWGARWKAAAPRVPVRAFCVRGLWGGPGLCGWATAAGTCMAREPGHAPTPPPPALLIPSPLPAAPFADVSPQPPRSPMMPPSSRPPPPTWPPSWA